MVESLEYRGMSREQRFYCQAGYPVNGIQQHCIERIAACQIQNIPYPEQWYTNMLPAKILFDQVQDFLFYRVFPHRNERDIRLRREKTHQIFFGTHPVLYQVNPYGLAGHPRLDPRLIKPRDIDQTGFDEFVREMLHHAPFRIWIILHIGRKMAMAIPITTTPSTAVINGSIRLVRFLTVDLTSI